MQSLHRASLWLLRASLLSLCCMLLMATGSALAEEPVHPDAHTDADTDQTDTQTDTHAGSHADTHVPIGMAPIGVMGDHVHHEGGMMLSYRYMKMRMDGNRDGSKQKSRSDLLLPDGDWPVVPTDMDMEMHMLGFMYAPRNHLSLMLMVPILKKSMYHTTSMAVDFTTESTGLGDIGVAALVNVWGDDMHEVHLNLGASFPTGSINRQDETPASGGDLVALPYPMQLGSGTVDLRPGATYNGRRDELLWGAQLHGTIRLGRNKEDYRLGNDYVLTGWSTYKILDWLSGGLRIQYKQWFNIKGRDRRIAGMGVFDPEDFVPTADPNRQAGKRLELGPSVNFFRVKGPLEGVRLGVEALFPLYRDLDGPKLETDWTLIAGIEYAF